MEVTMRRLSAIVSVLVVVGSAAFAQNDAATKKFLTQAIEGNYAEVQMGELAPKNAQSDDVKSFGQMLVTDHGKANQKAMEVAKSAGVTLPSGPNAKQKADYEKLAKRTGAAFDREFAQHMVTDHKKDIAEYRKQAKVKNAAGQYSEETLPVLQRHLDIALGLEKKLSKK
jgi:putative membrane protein